MTLSKHAPPHLGGFGYDVATAPHPIAAAPTFSRAYALADFWWQMEAYLERHLGHLAKEERAKPKPAWTGPVFKALYRQHWLARAALMRAGQMTDVWETHLGLGAVVRWREENDRRDAAHRAHPRSAVLGGRRGVPNGAECLAAWDFT